MYAPPKHDQLEEIIFTIGVNDNHAINIVEHPIKMETTLLSGWSPF